MVINILTIDKMCTIVGCDEYSYLGDRMFPILFDREKREQMFYNFLEYESDLSKDWFSSYFEQYISDRKNLKQDYTPTSVTRILSEILGPSESTFEPTAGTGAITIAKWDSDRKKETPLTYRPSKYLYWAEELSDKNIPFLLFNLLIRGMNAVVVHGESLERKVKQVYLLANDRNDYMSFGSLNVMPRSRDCEEYFDVRSWVGDAIHHVESPCYLERK